jgi:hypothetical protein
MNRTAAIVGLMLALMTVRVQAEPAPPVTYNFIGVCEDCWFSNVQSPQNPYAPYGPDPLRPARAQLTLQGYQLGEQITVAHFISFKYFATDHFTPSLEITTGQPLTLEGSIEYLASSFNGLRWSNFRIGDGDQTNETFFATFSTGDWCIGSSTCAFPTDFGYDYRWTTEADVPGPPTAALLGLGLLALGAAARKRA